MFILASLVGFVSLTSFKKHLTEEEFIEGMCRIEYDKLFIIDTINNEEIVRVNKEYYQELDETLFRAHPEHTFRTDAYVEIYPYLYKYIKDSCGILKVKNTPFQNRYQLFYRSPQFDYYTRSCATKDYMKANNIDSSYFRELFSLFSFAINRNEEFQAIGEEYIYLNYTTK